MSKQLIIAEKPSVASDIARVLKCGQKGNGCFFNDEYVISWAIGHLVALSDPEDYNSNFKKWKKEDLPIIPDKIKVKAIKNTKQQLDILNNLMNDKDISYLICATDSGREGELIFRYIYEITKCSKPFKRLWISSMTDAAIKAGFENLKDGREYDNLYLSAKCRSEADWLVGINASRAFTLKYNVLLSIGRVQTPTLAILVNRQKEINSFVSRDYWEVEADFGKYKGIRFDANNNETKIFDKNEAEKIVNKVKNKDALVKNIDYEEKKQAPPLLYDLTELQRDCNKKFGYSAQKTLSLAQDLYEKRKMITYPRTDSRYISDDIIDKLKIILNKLNAVDKYNCYASYVLGLKKLPITKRIADNSKISDHHAIIPTEVNIRLDILSNDEFNVYDLIARRFIQVFYPHYIYGTTKVITESEGECFISKGTMVIQKGWTKLNKISEKEKNKKESEPMPEIKKGEELNVKNVKALKKETKPPSLYNEATLLSAMENAGRFVENEELKEQLKESGLGTPATRAAIIERLIKVGYVVRKGKNLIPTDKGIKLVSVVPQELKSAETTGRWEKGLSSVAKGKLENKKFMESIKRYVYFLVDNAEKNNINVIFSSENTNKKSQKVKKESLGICPNCHGEIYENSKSFYCSNWNRGCKFSVWKNSLEQYDFVIDKEIFKNILSNKTTIINNVKNPATKNDCNIEVKIRDNQKGGLSVISVK